MESDEVMQLRTRRWLYGMIIAAALISASCRPQQDTQIASEVCTPTPSPTILPGTTYVYNSNTMRFHYFECDSAKLILGRNYHEGDGPREVLIELGYVPCKNCQP